MATTVDAIAQAAFDAVSVAITDAVHDATITDGTTDYAGRVVFGGGKPPGGFPMSKAETRVRPVYLEGFSAIPQPGWVMTCQAVVHYVLAVRDVAEAGGFQVASVIKHADMLWRTGSFQRQSRTSDGAGGYAHTWANIAGASDLSIGMVALSGSERFASQRTEATASHRVIMRWVDGIKASDSLLIGSTRYNIRLVDDHEGRNIWLVLDVAEGVAS